MKNIIGFSSTRADYDLMSPLFKKLSLEPNVNFSIILSGTHTSQSHGNSGKFVRADGIQIAASINSLEGCSDVDTQLAANSALLSNILKKINSLQPDLFLYAGDREDLLIYSMIGLYLRVPTIHFYGGDHETDGLPDTVTRHAVSKLSTHHAVIHDEHFERLKRIGEPSFRITNTGSMAVEAMISELKFINQRDKPKHLDFSGKFCLCIYHPAQDPTDPSEQAFENILETLLENKIPTAISYPNIDNGRHHIMNIIEKFKDNKNFYIYSSLARKNFLYLYKFCDFLIGNSSSGILEAASVPVGVINVGSRQQNRKADQNVIFCGVTKAEIRSAIDKISSDSFKKVILSAKNSYYQPNSTEKILRLLRHRDFKAEIKKTEDPLL